MSIKTFPLVSEIYLLKVQLQLCDYNS